MDSVQLVRAAIIIAIIAVLDGLVYLAAVKCTSYYRRRILLSHIFKGEIASEPPACPEKDVPEPRTAAGNGMRRGVTRIHTERAGTIPAALL